MRETAYLREMLHSISNKDISNILEAGFLWYTRDLFPSVSLFDYSLMHKAIIKRCKYHRGKMSYTPSFAISVCNS